MNLTTIPSRFKHLQGIVDNIRTHDEIDNIYIHIPRVYTNFRYESLPKITGAIVNVVDVDYGPARRYVYAQGDDVIVIIDDDTLYHPECSKMLVEKHRKTGQIWGGSGFNFRKYFVNDFSKVPNEQVQMVEGFGMIVLNKNIIDTVRDDVIKYALEFNTTDDILLNNLYDKYGFDRFYYCEPNWIRQLSYGFESDALHVQNNGGHMDAYKKSLRKLRVLNQMFFKPCVTYGITVCNEAHELRQLLEVLVDTMIHSDEIVVLADDTKVNDDVEQVIYSFGNYIRRYSKRPFYGNFSTFKNILNDISAGEYIFQLDADEIPTGTLIEKVYHMTHADLVYIPRVNIMLGMTQDAISLHGFHVNESGFINFPDMQGRFYHRELTWDGAVHEKIQGAKRISQIPPDPKLSLWHVKTCRKSKQQKEFYERMG